MTAATESLEAAKRAYPGKDNWGYSDLYDYEPLLKTLGEIVVQVDDDEYQGDSYLVLRDGERFGYLIFGWGSCSGCDWLQDCNSYEDVAELHADLVSKIHWEPSSAELRKWMIERDWSLQHDSYGSRFDEFLPKALAALEPSTGTLGTERSEGA